MKKSVSLLSKHVLCERGFERKEYSCDDTAPLLSSYESLWLFPVLQNWNQTPRSQIGNCWNIQGIVANQLKAVSVEDFQHSFQGWEQGLC